MAKIGKDFPSKASLFLDSPSKKAKQPGVVEKEADTTKGVALDATKPPTTPQDLPQEKEVPPRKEIVLATLPMPAKGDLKGKGQEAIEAALTQSTKAPAKDKIVIKKK